MIIYKLLINWYVIEEKCMGLLDKVKSNMGNTPEKRKDGGSSSENKRINDVESFNAKVLRKREEKVKKEVEKINKIRNKFNIYKGIDCKVQFPQLELILKSHSGLKRGIATFTLGFVGFAATSNVKQEKKHIVKNTQLQIADRGVVFKKVTDDGKDLRIPYDNIISFTVLTQKIGKKGEEFYELLLLENQSLIISFSKQLKGNELEIISQDLVDVINGRATGKDTEEAGWGLDYATNGQSSEVDGEEKSAENSSIAGELEKIVQIYEKGLLTDEEFAAMKKKIIEK